MQAENIDLSFMGAIMRPRLEFNSPSASRGRRDERERSYVTTEPTGWQGWHGPFLADPLCRVNKHTAEKAQARRAISTRSPERKASSFALFRSPSSTPPHRPFPPMQALEKLPAI